MLALLILFFIFILFFIVIPKRVLGIYFLIFTILLSLISFFIKPFETMDLFRHFIILESLRSGGWDALINFDLFESLPLFGYYFYVISLLPYNGFLPAITTFLVYTSSFSIHIKTFRELKSPKIVIFLGVLLFITTFNYLAMVSGIRNMLAFAIFAYVLYYDLVYKKNAFYSWIFYILLCFLHSSVIILVLLRILLVFYNKMSSKIIIPVLLGWSFSLEFILKIVANLTYIDFFNLLYMQILGYSAVDYYSLLPIINKVLIISLIFIMSLFNIYNFEHIPKGFKKIQTYILIVLCFTLGSVLNYNIFIRFSDFLSILSPIVIMLTAEVIRSISHANYDLMSSKNNNKVSIYFNLIKLMILSISVYSFIYLLMFQYRYVILSSNFYFTTI